jgi:hypothetical protein
LNSFYRRRQYVAYVDGVLMFGQLVSVVEEVIQIKEAAVSTVLVINGSKARYMKMNRNMTNLEQGLIMNIQVLEGGQNLDI